MCCAMQFKKLGGLWKDNVELEVIFEGASVNFIVFVLAMGSKKVTRHMTCWFGNVSFHLISFAYVRINNRFVFSKNHKVI